MSKTILYLNSICFMSNYEGYLKKCLFIKVAKLINNLSGLLIKSRKSGCRYNISFTILINLNKKVKK